MSIFSLFFSTKKTRQKHRQRLCHRDPDGEGGLYHNTVATPGFPVKRFQMMRPSLMLELWSKRGGTALHTLPIIIILVEECQALPPPLTLAPWPTPLLEECSTTSKRAPRVSSCCPGGGEGRCTHHSERISYPDRCTPRVPTISERSGTRGESVAGQAMVS